METALRHGQTQLSEKIGQFGLPVSVVSPYFHGQRGTSNTIMLKAIILDYLDNPAVPMSYVGVGLFNGTNGDQYLDAQSLPVFLETAVNTLDLLTKAKTSIQAYCTTNSYGTVDQWFGEFKLPEYISYQALVTQTSTSAPSATTLNNDFFGTTFTWARTATGVYTLTASTAIFVSGKTGIFIGASGSPLNNVNPVRTSSTVLTFTSSQLNLLALGIGNVDGLLSNTLIEVRIYA